MVYYRVGSGGCPGGGCRSGSLRVVEWIWCNLIKSPVTETDIKAKTRRKKHLGERAVELFPGDPVAAKESINPNSTGAKSPLCRQSHYPDSWWSLPPWKSRYMNYSVYGQLQLRFPSISPTKTVVDLTASFYISLALRATVCTHEKDRWGANKQFFTFPYSESSHI